MVLARAPRLNAARLARAFEFLGQPSAAALLSASQRDWRRAQLAPSTCSFLSQTLPSALERRWVADPAHRLLPFTDALFPHALRAAPRHPLALYVVGHVEALNQPQLAIVGSRNPTAGGRDLAFHFARELAGFGLTITSGLASGVDGAAHRGALHAQGRTIAVLGCGVDRVYPRGHRALREQIGSSGALVSEFALGEPPRAQNFPRRNATIAGLSLGTLVVEATPRSGSLLTARLTAQHNRPVFAVPGSIHNPLSRGCHDLIRQGAKLTESAADILSALDFSASPAVPPPAYGEFQKPPSIEAGMDKDHKILLDALGFDPTDLDTLVSRSGLKPETVSSMMLILELKGHVQAAPGGRFSRVRSRGEI
jgi:DNA processing protein